MRYDEFLLANLLEEFIYDMRTQNYSKRRYKRISNKYFRRIETSYTNFFLSRSGRPLTTVMVENEVREAGKKARV